MTRELTFAGAVNEALAEEMERDDEMVVMGQDVRYGYLSNATKGLVEEFGPDRVVNTPIAENSMVGTGIGTAMGEIRTVVEAQFCDALLLAMDQLTHQATKLRPIFDDQVRVPLVVRAMSGHFPAAFGPQHSKNLTALFTHIPGLKVLAPSTPYQAKGLLKTAIRDDDPVLVLEHVRVLNSGDAQPVPEEEYAIPYEDGLTVRQEGTDVTIVASSWMVEQAELAAERLAEDGVDARVVDIAVIDPLDRAGLVDAVADTGRVVIADEGFPRCGVSADIAALLADEAIYSLDAPIKRVNAEETHIPANMEHQEAVIPDADDLVEAVGEIV